MRAFPRFFALPVLACALLGAHVARGDVAIGADEVTLKDGGTLRGTIVTQEPGQRVEILVLGENTPRVVPWVDVDRVERGKFAAHKDAAQPASPGTPPGIRDVGIVTLHITSPVPVDLYAHTEAYGQSDNGTSFVLDASTLVCTSPCETRIDTRHPHTYTVAGLEAVQSESFSLSGLSGNQELTVSPGSPALYGGSALLAGLGATAVGVGLILTIGGAVAKAQDDSAEKIETAGLVTLTSGAVALIGGLVMLASSKTTIQIHPSDPPATAPRVARAPRYWAGEF